MGSILLSHFYHVLEVLYTLFQDLGNIRILLLACISSRTLLVILGFRKACIGYETLIVVLHVKSLRLREVNWVLLTTSLDSR